VEAAEVGSRFLYVAEQGTMLRRSGSRVVVARKDETLLDVPAVRLQGVLVYGNVQVSTQCFRNLLSEGVWVSFFSRNGTYRGRLQPPAERGGRLRRRQWTSAADPGFCLEFSKAVVRGKVLSARAVAAAYAKNRAAESLGTAHLRLRECLSQVDEVSDLAALRGIEGTAGRAYFDLFARWNSSDLPFDGREKRGTSNPVNALLNFGYTLLTRELEGLLEAAGLDPTVGFYHSPDDDRPSLACDWVEEFRHGIVDRLVLTLVNKRMIRVEHFEDGEDRRGVRMTSDGLRVYLAAYERTMRRPWLDDEDAGAVAGVRSVFLQQLARLLDALAGRAPYRTHVEDVPVLQSPVATEAQSLEQEPAVAPA
jgi:CRISPR-associated protein Cas1